MSAKKTPITIDRVRDMYSWATGWKPDVDPESPHMADVQASLRAEFDAALAAHDAEKRAEWEAELLARGTVEWGTAIPEAIQEDAYKERSGEVARRHVERCDVGCVLVSRIVGPWEPVEQGDE